MTEREAYFREIVEKHRDNEALRNQMQAMTFYANSDEEMIKQVKKWLDEKTLDLPVKKKKWWQR